MTVAATRCEFERWLVRNQPLTPECKSHWKLLRASFDNAERYPDHPLVLKFFAEDVARFETIQKDG